MTHLYRLLEDKRHKEIVHLLLFFWYNSKFLRLKTQLFDLFYVSCSFTLLVCGGTRTSRSVKVSNWDILEFRSQFEIRTFIFLNTLDYGTLINKEIEESISNNFDVLCWNSPRCCPRSSPDDGWIRFLFYKTCRKISQEDSVKKLGWLIYKWRRY